MAAASRCKSTIIAYTGGEVRRQFNMCFRARLLGGDLEVSDSALCCTPEMQMQQLGQPPVPPLARKVDYLLRRKAADRDRGTDRREDLAQYLVEAADRQVRQSHQAGAGGPGGLLRRAPVLLFDDEVFRAVAEQIELLTLLRDSEVRRRAPAQFPPVVTRGSANGR